MSVDVETPQLAYSRYLWVRHGLTVEDWHEWLTYPDAAFDGRCPATGSVDDTGWFVQVAERAAEQRGELLLLERAFTAETTA